MQDIQVKRIAHLLRSIFNHLSDRWDKLIYFLFRPMSGLREDMSHIIYLSESDARSIPRTQFLYWRMT